MRGSYTEYYRRLHLDMSIPEGHVNYLKTINYTPTIVYDIGAAVLHWTKEAKNIWPSANYYAFEAIYEVSEFYEEYGIPHTIGVLSNEDGRDLIYYNNPTYLGGNSYYKESSQYSSLADTLYSTDFQECRITTTLDTAVKNAKYPLPDLIKIDVQGAELDILSGAKDTLKNVKHLIVELQHVQYNIGAKLVNDSIPFIESLGFELVDNGSGNKYFQGNGPDADYHFVRKSLL